MTTPEHDLPRQPDGIGDHTTDLPELNRAAERVHEYIAANGDGIYDVIDGHPLYARDLEALRRAADHVWAAEQIRVALAQFTDRLDDARKAARELVRLDREHLGAGPEGHLSERDLAPLLHALNINPEETK